MRVSVVVPVYCEEQNLPVLYRRLQGATSAIDGTRWNFIFVNDGSTDDSMRVLRELAQQDARVRVIDLSRNFGKEVALSAGVTESDADAVICMDADLQHPPELISRLIEEWRNGAEVVVTIRKSIAKQPLLRRIGSHIYYWLMRQLSGLDMVSQTTDFRLYDRKVVEAFRRVTERQRLFRGVMDWMGFRRRFVEFHAGPREAGAPTYSYAQLWQLAVNSITAFSLWPLRLTGYLGVAITLLSGVLLAWMLFTRAFLNRDMFTPLAIVVVANTFLIGIVLVAIGLVALYIGTIHTEVINRPLYVVRERINFEQDADR